MKYTITQEMKELIAQADAKLNNIESKGESLMNLALARMFLKQVYESITEEVSEPEKEKGDT